ncbi:MAG TPA: peptidoglycan-associated lipoprotein Pal [Gemmatimonadota bacterium]|nr:peptidoglycan-associated lipoprotein Pal [Gemmatimonadota bacterium]
MAARRILTLGTTTLVVALVALGCSRRQAETDPMRDRTEPPPTTTTPPVRDDGYDAERAAMERAMASIQQPIYFEFDQSDLSSMAREELQRKAEVLRAYPEIRVRIEGHCDERGTVEYNLALGERRAEAARGYLIDLGIDPDRMTTVSYGEERPAVMGSNEAAWSQNRRDEFVPLGV